MKFWNVVNQIYDLVTQHMGDSRVLLLHPRSRYRSVVVAQLVHSGSDAVFYHALGADDTSVDSFVNGLAHEIAKQNPLFGRHVHRLNERESVQEDLLLEALIKDLNELSSQPYLLILDEYDRSDSADDVQWFMEKLIDHLPEHCHLLINSRTLPRLPWISLIAQRFATILRDEHIVRENFYETFGGGTNLLEVYALGPSFVMFNERPIDTWEGHLPRLLFFFALDRPMITRSEICEAFWPELVIDQAVNVFHVTKRRLHKALDLDVLVHEDGYYRINPELNVDYDAGRFVSHLMDGRDQTESERVAAWQQVIDIYRGPFLQGHTEPWILNRRADFRAGYLEALTAMADYRLANGRHEVALNLLQKAAAEDVHRDDIHQQIMRLFTEIGRRSEAASHFQRVEDELTHVGAQVSPELRAAYEAIMA